MKLSKEQQEKLRDLLNDWPGPQECPWCGKDEWAISDELVLLQSMRQASDLRIGRGQPCVAVQCLDCGNVLVFNAFRLGVGELLNLNQVPKGD